MTSGLTTGLFTACSGATALYAAASYLSSTSRSLTKTTIETGYLDSIISRAAADGLVIGHRAVMHTVRRSLQPPPPFDSTDTDAGLDIYMSRSGAFVNLLVCCVAAAYTHRVGLTSVRREGLYTKPNSDTVSQYFNINGIQNPKLLDYYKTGGARQGVIRNFLDTDYNLSMAARTVFTTLVRHGALLCTPPFSR